MSHIVKFRLPTFFKEHNDNDYDYDDNDQYCQCSETELGSKRLKGVYAV